MILTVEQMPLSFSGRAFIKGATWLGNSPNQGLALSGVKILARLIYQLVVFVLLAPLGILYHLAQSLRYMLTGASDLAGEHFIAAGYDLKCIITPNLFFLGPEKFASTFVSDSLVTVTHPTLSLNVPPLTGTPSYPADWAFHQCSFALCRYSYSALVENALKLNLPLKDSRVLRAIQQRAWSCRLMVDRYPVHVPISASLGRHVIEEVAKPTGLEEEYTFPWECLAIVVLGLALVALGIVALRIVGKKYYPHKPGQLIICSILGCDSFYIGIILSCIESQRSYRNNRGQAELSAAQKGNALYWYSKALRRGYEPAQRAYGLFQLIQGDGVRQGVEWLVL